MASDSKKSNQAAGEGKRYCHRAHWLSVLGLLQSLEIPADWRENTINLANLTKWYGGSVQIGLAEMACDCIDCRRQIPKIGDRNKHGERT